MDDSFFTGYRKTAVRPQEVLVSIEIPYSKKAGHDHWQNWTYRCLDSDAFLFISTDSVLLGLQTVASQGGWHQHRHCSAERHLLSWDQHSWGLEDQLRRHGRDHGDGKEDSEQAEGKVDNSDDVWKRIERWTCHNAVLMSSRQWGDELLEEACSSLAEEMTLDPSAPGGMVTYRRTLTLSLFYKFYLTVLQKLKKQVSLFFHILFKISGSRNLPVFLWSFLKMSSQVLKVDVLQYVKNWVNFHTLLR